MTGVRSLVELLRARAAEVGERVAFRWLQDGEHESVRLSYRDLDLQARALAAKLAEQSTVGDRALLVFAPGVEFITAFFGCLYAGVIAVPVYPPRQEKDLKRLFGVLQDAEPASILTTSSLRKRMERQIQLPILSYLHCIEIDTLASDLSESWRDPGVNGDTLAFLQYTSGSTSAPKGVQVHHRHLLHNETMIQQAFAQTEDSRVVSWLPLYHDMGLIGGVLQPLFLGASCVLMSPAAFLKRPIRWLQAISRYEATTSGGPNFAYDLCTHRIPQEDLEGLDLSSWEVAFNGAEPIRAETLDRFTDRFSSFGFTRRAFYPCYGLAEGTLFVSGGGPDAEPVIRDFDPLALEQGQAKREDEGACRSLVGCGASWMGQDVRIVDPRTCEPLAEGGIGEIWVSGPSIAGGYWRREEASVETFEARLNTGEGPFLRTGDLGFLDAGEIFIAGRLKDLIILRGRNLYPQDIERTVETSHRGLRLGCSAAFSVELEGEERLVVVQEIDPNARGAAKAIFDAVRGAVAEAHQAALHELVLVPPHTVPKTSSGKIQRRLCRKLYLREGLEILERLSGVAVSEAEGTEVGASEFDGWTVKALWTLPAEQQHEALCAFLRHLGEHHLGQPMTGATSYLQQGMDSLRAVTLQHEIETALGIQIPIAHLLEGMTIDPLAASLLEDLRAQNQTVSSEVSSKAHSLKNAQIVPEGATVGVHPTTAGQQALLALEHRAPSSAALHVSAAVRLFGVDAVRLQQALEGLVARHPALRTTFRVETAEPQQIVHEDGTFEGAGSGFLTDASCWSAAEFEEHVSEEAHRPFDLEAGPLMRCLLFKRAESEHVLLWVVHHLVCDLWSWSVMVRDLGRFYQDPRLAAPSIEAVRFTDHVRLQQQKLDGADGAALEGFWRETLRDVSGSLDLPTDRPHQALQSFQGQRIVARMDRALLDALEQMGQRSGTTLYTTLIAAYQALLWRYTGQTRFAVGSPMVGRRRAEVSEVVGYFVHLVPVACDLRQRPTFQTLLERARETTLAALEHQDFPLPLMVDRLLPGQRDLSRPPIFQTLFVLQSAVAGGASLGAFALGMPGASLDLAGVRAESMALAQRGSQFELTLTATEMSDGLALSLLYSTALFDEVRMWRLLEHFEILLRGALAEPDRPLSEISLLSPEEAAQLRLWGDLDGRCPAESVPCLEEAFAQQVLLRPDSIALVEGEGRLTYRNLDQQADQLAAHLRASGIGLKDHGLEDRVALCLGRNSRLIVGILAVLKSGAAYVPLDPQHPEERLRFVLEDAAPNALLVEEASLNALTWLAEQPGLVLVDQDRPERRLAAPRSPSASPDRAAYLIYTSGSTGRPKGVVVSHRSVQSLMASARGEFALDERDVWTLFHAIAFDFSVWELWGSLTHGGCLVIVPYETSRTPEAFRHLLCDERVTILSQTPTAFRQLVQVDQEQGDTLNIRLVAFGGEALDLASLAPWVEKHGDQHPKLINLYGITETTVHVTHRQILKGDLNAAAAPLGPPLPGWRVQLLDARGQPVPVGVPGEICVGGVGLAWGYHQRLALTAQRFVPDARSNTPGDRLYRSGDLARFDFEGEWVYFGRLDHQVKIRGFRIELGEIETALQQHPAIQDGVVLARQDAGDEARLVAYWVARQDLDDLPSVVELRSFLGQSLPEYMVPSAFLRLDALPLTGNGKLDRRALPAPSVERPDLEVTYQAPRTDAEMALSQVWSEVLGVEQVGIDDPYFALGGDSIRSIRVQALMRVRGYSLAFEDLYHLPTVRQLAPHLKRAEAGVVDGTAEPFALLDESDRKLLPQGLDDAFPLTSVQTGMIYQSETHPDYEIYLTSLHLQGPFRPDLFRQALLDQAKRHSILRTSFELARFSQPLQLVWNTASAPLAVIDLRDLPEAQQEADIEHWLNAERRRIFVWDRAPLFRITLHRRQRLDDGEERFQLTLSEPFFDGWSVGTFLTELVECYLALHRAEQMGETVAASASLASSYRQFVAVEQATIASPDSQGFWDGVLDGAEPSRVPSWAALQGRSISADDASVRVGRWAVPVSAELSDALLDLARKLQLPIKNLLLAAHVKTLSVLTGRRDLLTGLLENGRPETLDGERLLGLFLNAVCFRQTLRGQSLADLARESLEAERALLRHRRMPLAILQQARGGEALFDTVFNYTHFHVYEGIEALSEVSLLDSFASEQTYYDLTAQFNRDHVSGRIRLVLDYLASRFEAAQIETIGEMYERVLRLFVEKPERPENASSLLSTAEEQRLLTEWQAIDPEFTREIDANEPSGGLHREFERQVQLDGGRRALFTDSESLTYTELNERANRLARRWRSLGLQVDDGVAIHMERSPELVIALLAVLKSSAFYLPLDPAAPRERLIFMLDDSRCSWLISDQNNALEISRQALRQLEFSAEEEAAREEPSADLDLDAMPQQAAYLIYTSGSTGRPKGVVGSHGATLNRLRFFWHLLPYDQGEVACQKTFFSFVDAVAEIFSPLLAGVPSLIVGDATVRDHQRFLAALAQGEVSRIVLVPSLLRVLLSDPNLAQQLPRLRYGFTSGEALPADLARLFHQRLPGRRLFNIYGSSEVAADVTWYEVKPEHGEAESVPIGQPIGGHASRVLDPDLNLLPVGAEGQIAVSGRGLSQGYLARGGLTAERFVPDPFATQPGERMYLTGDLGCFRPDGALLIRGRRDQQVKIRGMRIEPGEIEAVLLAHPEIEAAVVRAWDGESGARLVAYVVPSSTAAESTVESDDLRALLKGQVPGAFLPEAFVFLEKLPLTPSGKLDRRALPVPDWRGSESASGFIAPRTATEEMLAGIWSEVLGLKQVSTADDFHALGGHSLLATQVISRLRQAFDVELPLTRLFEAPTIQLLAQEVEVARQGRAKPPLVPVAERRQLSFAQQRLCFIDRLAPGDPVYNMPGAVRLVGELDISALASALAGVVARHETLRTHFVTVGTGFEQRLVDAIDLEFPLVDLSALPDIERQAEARRVQQWEVRRSFDLFQGPLLRALLIRLAEDDHEFLLTLHHVVSDGWSQGVLIQELITLYGAQRAGQAARLPELPVQYSDFAHWQRAWLDGAELERQTRWWKEQLGEDPPILDLPSDHARPEELSSQGGVIRRRFEADFLNRIQAFARQESSSLFMTLMAAFEVVMHYASGQDDLVIGTDVANRDQVELEGLIGFFVNQLVLRFSLAGDPTFRDVLERTRQHTLGAYAHQDLPFDKLVEAINPPRERNRTPLFQIKFVLQNTPQPPLAVPGLAVTPLEVDTRTAKFDQLWNLWERDGELLFAVEYRSDLFLAKSIERLLDLYRRTLELAQERPEATVAELSQELGESERAWQRDRQERWRRASQGRFKKLKPKTRIGGKSVQVKKSITKTGTEKINTVKTSSEKAKAAQPDREAVPAHQDLD